MHVHALHHAGAGLAVLGFPHGARHLAHVPHHVVHHVVHHGMHVLHALHGLHGLHVLLHHAGAGRRFLGCRRGRRRGVIARSHGRQGDRRRTSDSTSGSSTTPSAPPAAQQQRERILQAAKREQRERRAERLDRVAEGDAEAPTLRLEAESESPGDFRLFGQWWVWPWSDRAAGLRETLRAYGRAARVAAAGAAAGAGTGAATGAISGGVIGALFGGVGAGPGAFAGALGGASAGAVSGLIIAAFSDTASEAARAGAKDGAVAGLFGGAGAAFAKVRRAAMVGRRTATAVEAAVEDAPWLRMSDRMLRRWLESLQNTGRRLTDSQTRELLTFLEKRGWKVVSRVETKWVGGPHIHIVGPGGGPRLHLPVPPGFTYP